MGTCPSPEQPNSQAVFTPGSRIYFTTYYRDQMGADDDVHHSTPGRHRLLDLVAHESQHLQLVVLVLVA
jgi:hypothetical protein